MLWPFSSEHRHTCAGSHSPITLSTVARALHATLHSLICKQCTPTKDYSITLIRSPSLKSLVSHVTMLAGPLSPSPCSSSEAFSVDTCSSISPGSLAEGTYALMQIHSFDCAGSIYHFFSHLCSSS